MRRYFHVFIYLSVILFALLGEFFVIGSFTPDAKINAAVITIPIVEIFFGLLFVLVFFSITLLLKSKLQGVLLAIFVCIYLFFRMEGLTKLLYQILLLLIFLSIELFFYQKNQERKER